MIPAQQTQNEFVNTIIGEELSFSVKSLANIFDLLHKSMYNDKPTAVAREVISNAIDANIESKTKNKVIVTYPTKLVPMFTVQDFGVGINKERLECFSSYGSSTKTNSNKEIGGFGLGAKSPWSITDQFTITTICNGIKYKYLCYIDGSGIGKVKEIFAIPTDEASGTIMEIPVNDKDHISRIKDQTQLFWLCNPDKITIKDQEDFNIYDTIQHKCSIRGFCPSNIHVYDWQKYGICNQIIVLNGYVPYMYDNCSPVGCSGGYTYVAKYDIGVLDLPATREVISNTPKNNKILRKIRPKIDLAVIKLQQFLNDRKKKNESIGAITTMHCPVRLTSVEFPREYTHSIYTLNSFGHIKRLENKYYHNRPQSPSTCIPKDIIIEIDDSKKHNIPYEKYAEHILSLHPDALSLFFVAPTDDRTREIFKIIPLHCFTPTPQKRITAKKTDEQIQEAKEKETKRKFWCKTEREWVYLETILKNPELYRKVSCERGVVLDDVIDKHIDNLHNTAQCKYQIIPVNKSEQRFFKTVSEITEQDFELNSLVYRNITNAYLLRYIARLVKKQSKYKSDIMYHIEEELKSQNIILFGDRYYDRNWVNEYVIKKNKIKEDTKEYPICIDKLKQLKKIAYQCAREFVSGLNDVGIVLSMVTSAFVRDKHEEYKSKICKIFEPLKEIYNES